MKKRYQKIVILLLLFTVASTTVGCAYFSQSEPLLNVTVQRHGWLIFVPEQEYYCVYQNGHYKKIEEYEINKGVFYRVGIDESDGRLSAIKSVGNEEIKSGTIVDYAQNILDLLDGFSEESGILGCTIYELDNRYFVVIFVRRPKSKDYTDTIYQYFPAENRLEEIVTFKNKVIGGLQLVE